MDHILKKSTLDDTILKKKIKNNVPGKSHKTGLKKTVNHTLTQDTSGKVKDKHRMILNSGCGKSKIIHMKSLNKINKKKSNHNTKKRTDAEKLIIGRQMEIENGEIFDIPESRNNSIEDGLEIFKKIISPIGVKPFFGKFWEKKPCFIQKNNTNFFKNLISFEVIDQMLRDNHIEFTKNVDIALYKNGKRQSLNPEGRALPSDVWNFYNDGSSIRILNPQCFITPMYKLNATLQEYFHCMVGANVYLTPPNSQGFAPHYDDIEAFVLQIEGRKKWKIYAPRIPNEELPRYSSGNLNPKEIGNSILDVEVKAGDVLYFPRGFIHYAQTVPECHSLHITLSVYQKQSYADLFECLFPMTLSNAIKSNVNLRQGLPLNIWQYLGSAYCKDNNEERKMIISHCKTLLKQIIDEIPLDEAVDELAKKYQHDVLPPSLSQNEFIRTVFGHKTAINHAGKAILTFKLLPETKIRLLRANILRLVAEENTMRIYFYIDNSKEYHEYEPNFIEIEEENASAIKQLIKSYPKFMKVKDLSLKHDEDKVFIAQYLWGRGLIITKEPLI